MKGKVLNFIIKNAIKIIVFTVIYLVVSVLIGFRYSLGILGLLIIYGYIEWSKKHPIIKLEELEKKLIKKKKKRN